MAQTYATIENLVLEKAPSGGEPLVFDEGDYGIWEAKVLNGDSRFDIYLTVGFGYKEGTVFSFLSSSEQTIGWPLPGEVIVPFGEIECTRDVVDAAINGKDILFLAVCGHDTGAGIVIDSSYSINVAIKKPENGNGNGKINWTTLIIIAVIAYALMEL